MPDAVGLELVCLCAEGTTADQQGVGPGTEQPSRSGFSTLASSLDLLGA